MDRTAKPPPNSVPNSQVQRGGQVAALLLAWQAAEPGLRHRHGALRGALIEDHDLPASARAWATGGAREVRRERCEGRARAALRAVGESQADLAAEPKGAPWKVTVAA